MLELNKIYNMDCLEGLKLLDSESIDAIISDPPYQLTSTRVYPKDTKIEDISEQLKKNVEENTAYGSAIRGFLGKAWDVLPSVEILKECLRVLKSGAFALWLMTPRMDSQAEFVLRLKQAGFNIAFTPLYYCYASGFPKSMSLSKAVDKRLGFEREKIRVDSSHIRNPKSINGGHDIEGGDRPSWMRMALEQGYYDTDSNIPVSPQAKALNGAYAGYTPKPAVEVIIVAMKPIKESTYIAQALLHLKEPEHNQLGGTWLDDCRIPFNKETDDIVTKNPHTASKGTEAYNTHDYGKYNAVSNPYEASKIKGRFPANLLCSDNILNRGIITKSGGVGDRAKHDRGEGYGFKPMEDNIPNLSEDVGDFSRYFSLDQWYKVNIEELPKEQQKTMPFLITPKASTSERNEGLKETDTGIHGHGNLGNSKGLERFATEQKNIHPTVKPIKLMSYLITLATRENDIVLDPFLGSGTTAIASYKLNRKFIGFEKEPEYYKIAQERLQNYTIQRKLKEDT